MTEQEAIEKLQELNVALVEMAGHKINGIDKIFGWDEITTIAEAIAALEEIQQYRAIEKRLEDMYGGQLPLVAYVDVLEYALKEPGKPHPVNARILTYEDADAWEAYKAIGTVEQCREAVEKLRAKKPKLIGNAMICPNCPKTFKNDSVTACPNCGQKIDWE